MAAATAMRRYQSWLNQQAAVTGKYPSENEKQRMLRTFLEQEQSSQAQAQALGLQTKSLALSEKAQETSAEQFEKSLAQNQAQFNVGASLKSDEIARQGRASMVSGAGQLGLGGAILGKEFGLFEGAKSFIPKAVEGVRSLSPSYVPSAAMAAGGAATTSTTIPAATAATETGILGSGEAAVGDAFVSEGVFGSGEAAVGGEAIAPTGGGLATGAATAGGAYVGSKVGEKGAEEIFGEGKAQRVVGGGVGAAGGAWAASAAMGAPLGPGGIIVAGVIGAIVSGK